MSTRPVSEMSEDERRERLAELKARRRARLRKAARWTVLGTSVLCVLVLVAAYWLLQTIAGRDVLLAQIMARLPAGSSFTWSAIDGPLAGPLTLHDVDFQYDGVHFTAEKAYLKPDLRPLLGRKLLLDDLVLDNAVLELGPPSDTPFELPHWPDVLPTLEMPLSFQVDRIAVTNLRVTRQDEPLVTLHKLRGDLTLGKGELQTRALKVNTDRGDLLLEGHYLPRRNFETDLVVRGLLPIPDGGMARLGLAVRGNLDQLEMALAGHAPQPVHALVTLKGSKAPHWRATVSGDKLELGAWLPGTTATTPLSLAFDARGEGGMAHLEGRVQQGEHDIVLLPSKLSVKGQQLQLEPLELQAFGGTVSARGQADFGDSHNPSFRFAVSLAGLSWMPVAEAGRPPPVAVFLREAGLGLSGTLQAWSVTGTAAVERGEQEASLRVEATGDQDSARIQELVATTPGGKATVDGQIAWSPALQWQATARLDRFDPGYFVPGWDGQLSGDLVSSGTQQAQDDPQAEGALSASVTVPRLHGQLRGRTVDAKASVTHDAGNTAGDVRLAVGASRVQAKGSFGEQWELDAQLDPLHLNDLLPSAMGKISGTLRLRGTPSSPDITADLRAEALQWGDYQAKTVTIDGRLPWRGGQGALKVTAEAINAGMIVDDLSVTATGNLQQFAVEGRAGSEWVALSINGHAGQTATGWQGDVQTLDITPSKGMAWALQAPTRFRLDGNRIRLDSTCLAAVGNGSLCVDADWPTAGVNLRGEALPLSLMEPWLSLNENRRTYVRGALSVEGNLRQRGAGLQGQFRVVSPEGGVSLGDSGRGELLHYDNFNSTIDITPQTITAYVGIGFAGDGFVDARVSTGWSDRSPLVGDLYLNMSRLYWLELFSPDLVRPTGLLEGHVSLRGVRGAPQIGGNAKLTRFAGELPALGLVMSDGSGELVARSDGSASIRADVKTGGTGALHVTGDLSLFGQDQPLRLAISGKNVLVADIPEFRAIVDPDLKLLIDTDSIQLNGRVHIPEAVVDLERLDSAASVSDDVVVLDPADPTVKRPSPLTMDLDLSVGKNVRLSGFGLQGTLEGELDVVALPGREMTANGQLDIGGRYKAYGQDLTITRGQLMWNYSVISDPNVSIRAQRNVGAVTSGIEVTGRALHPRVSVWSDPSMSQSEALSYLVLGRSLSMASSDQADQVNAASAALSAGSGYLASQIGAKLGLDDAGVVESRALGGAVIGVGKYVTPKLYVGYGVSMIGAGSVVTLKYLLRRGFDMEFEASTVENRGSVNWRTEKD